MPHLSRRGFIAATLAAGSLRVVPRIVLREKSVLTLVYDKALGAMRAIDRVLP